MLPKSRELNTISSRIVQSSMIFAYDFTINTRGSIWKLFGHVRDVHFSKPHRKRCFSDCVGSKKKKNKCSKKDIISFTLQPMCASRFVQHCPPGPETCLENFQEAHTLYALQKYSFNSDVRAQHVDPRTSITTAIRVPVSRTGFRGPG